MFSAGQLGQRNALGLLTVSHPPDPQQTEGFRKRWFTMDDRRLMYFKDPLVRKVWLQSPAPLLPPLTCFRGDW